MLFMIAFEPSTADYKKVMNRFEKPAGVRRITQVARYFYADASGSYTITAANGPIAVSKW